MRKVIGVKRFNMAVIAASTCACLIQLSGCAKDINYIVDHEPSVRGTVRETDEEYIVIDVSEEDEVYDSYASLEVSLDVERKDSMTSFRVGDEVAVYYDGNIAETYPARINKVYAILYIGDPE